MTIALKLVACDGSAVVGLSTADLSQHSSSILSQLACDASASTGGGPAILKLVALPQSPLTSCAEALQLAAGLYRCGCFPADTLQQLLTACNLGSRCSSSNANNGAGSSTDDGPSGHGSSISSRGDVLDLLHALLDFLSIAGPVSRLLPVGCDDTDAISHFHFMALAREAVDIMLLCKPRPNKCMAAAAVAAAGGHVGYHSSPSSMFMLVASSHNRRHSWSAANTSYSSNTRSNSSYSGDAANRLSAPQWPAGSSARPQLSVYLLTWPPGRSGSERSWMLCSSSGNSGSTSSTHQAAPGGGHTSSQAPAKVYAQLLHSNGSSTLHFLEDVVAAAQQHHCCMIGCVGPDHPCFGSPLFEALCRQQACSQHQLESAAMHNVDSCDSTSHGSSSSSSKAVPSTGTSIDTGSHASVSSVVNTATTSTPSASTSSSSSSSSSSGIHRFYPDDVHVSIPMRGAVSTPVWVVQW